MNWDSVDRRVLTLAKIVALLGMVAATAGAFVGVEFSPTLLGLFGTVLLGAMTASAVAKGKQDRKDNGG